ncbi:lipid A biosynthesis lauroyl acyltransferase [Arcobacter sp. F2176]|uniref:lipid A biosynthesis lauroyl acyltransferase n=1 Tax=Arcobacter sp. F2176 TaxID=2044511 RepID=UPI00100BD881|nr:lipid A biosynthesis lauroyl acyltransferase [Arcobacter sp. F2176]RXJ81209.1 lipid A biosynthesis acyltransferase [Arcobacter sp. F2176]
MKRKIKDYYRYVLYKFFRFIFIITPHSILKPILIFSAKLVNKYNKRFNKVVEANLYLAFGNTLSQKRKEEIKFNSYKSLFFNMYEFIENQKISKEDLFKKANFENEHYIIDAIKNNRKIIFITAHYGGWEIALPYVALKFGTLAVVNRKMDNPLINKLYIEARDRNNIIMLEKKVAAKGMLKALKNNNHVAVVIDQHIKDGVEVEFFDKKVLATDATSRLSLKLDAIIIPIFSVMNDFRNYTLKVYEPLDPRNIEFKTEDKIKEFTKMQSDIIEIQIKETPDFWFWQHKRWKKFYKEIYK